MLCYTTLYILQNTGIQHSYTPCCNTILGAGLCLVQAAEAQRQRWPHWFAVRRRLKVHSHLLAETLHCTMTYRSLPRMHDIKLGCLPQRHFLASQWRQCWHSNNMPLFESGIGRVVYSQVWSCISEVKYCLLVQERTPLIRLFAPFSDCNLCCINSLYSVACTTYSRFCMIPLGKITTQMVSVAATVCLWKPGSVNKASYKSSG